MIKLFRIHKTIDSALFSAFVEKVKTCNSADILVLHFNSKGGDILLVQKMIQILLKQKITTVGVGYKKINSSSLALYVACTYRVAYDNAEFLIHNAYANDTKVSLVSIRNKEKELFLFIAERTNLSLNSLYLLAQNETYLSKQQAVNCGIVTLGVYSKTSGLR